MSFQTTHQKERKKETSTNSPKKKTGKVVRNEANGGERPTGKQHNHGAL